MSGTEQVDQTIIGKHPGEDDADAQRFFNQKLVLPVVLAIRDRVNKLTGAVFSVTESSAVPVKYGLILADASNGAIVLQLRPPAESSRGYEIVKVDGTANPVTIQVVDGSLISGSASFQLVAQWDGVGLASDKSKYVVVTGPPAQAAVLGPDVTGSLDDNTVVQLQRRPLASTGPVAYQLIRSIDAATWLPSYEGYPVAKGTVVFSLAAGNVDQLIWTVPASPSGSGRFMVQRAYARMSVAIVGTGTVAVRIGTSAGDNSIGVDQTVSSATAVGVIFSGQAVSSRGSALLVANSYEGVLAAGATIYARAATTGTISAGACEIDIYGAFLP